MYPFQRVTVDMNRARGGTQFAGDQLNDGGLTGSGRTNQKYKFAVLNLHGNAPQRLISLRIGLDYIFKFNHNTYYSIFVFSEIVPHSKNEVNRSFLYFIIFLRKPMEYKNRAACAAPFFMFSEYPGRSGTCGPSVPP